MPHYEKSDFKQWIDWDESAYGRVRSEYEEARKYVENSQTPTGIPSDKEYVQYNLITGRVRRSVGEMVSARITPILKGGGDAAAALRELFLDILEENEFQEAIIPEAMNYFYAEGFAGLKFCDDPFKLSKYGIGSPEIYFMRPGELRVDSNARSGMHTDDIRRMHVKQSLVDYARRKWPKFAPQINESSEFNQEYQDMKFCDIYEIEFRESEFETKQRGDKSFRVEKEVYYKTTIINKTVMVEPPRATGYPTFRLIPLIHTPRTRAEFGKYPIGFYGLLGTTQDQLNVTESVILDAVKASIKMLVTMVGANEDEIALAQQELSKTNGLINLMNPAGKVHVHQPPPIAPALLQMSDRIRFRFDEISQQYAPDRGQVSGELSGKAINQLQSAGFVPELTNIKNIEAAFTKLAVCIYTYIRQMKAPFSITRNIDGQERNIPFNTVFEPGMEVDREFSLVQNGIINPLEQMPVGMGLKIDVELNQLQKEDLELNKALLMRERGDLGLIDTMKAVYPHSWQDKIQNTLKENQAQALVQDLANTSPEFMQAIAQQVEQLKAQAQEAGILNKNGAIQ